MSPTGSVAAPKTEGAEEEPLVMNARRRDQHTPREYKSWHQLAFEASGTGGLAPVLQGGRTPAGVQSSSAAKEEDDEEPPPPPLYTLREQTRNFPTSLPIGAIGDPNAPVQEDSTACFIDSGSEELKEDTLFLIQLPSALPLPYDAKSVQKKPQEEAKTSLMGYPPGQCGKMVVYKSGKIKLKLGNCMMDVSLAKSGTFAQNLMAVNPTDDSAYFLGDVSHTMVVSPSLDELSIPSAHIPTDLAAPGAPSAVKKPDESSSSSALKGE